MMTTYERPRRYTGRERRHRIILRLAVAAWLAIMAGLLLTTWAL